MPNRGRKPTILTVQLVTAVLEYIKTHTQKDTAIHFGIAKGTVYNITHGSITEENVKEPRSPKPTPPLKGKEIEKEFGRETGIVTVRSLDVRTLEDALRVGEVDTAIWEVDRYVINSWETTARDENKELQTYTNWQVKVWLKRKHAEIRSLETLLDRISKHGPIISPHFHVKSSKNASKRELEISIMDPHLGLICHTPAAGQEWNIETCAQMFLEMTENLLEAAKGYGPFERIFLPVGNDLLHADNVFHTTTQGTLQPEMDAWHHAYVKAEEMQIQQIEMLKNHAPKVEVIIIPGNHDRQSSFTIGRLLNAYYHNDPSVEIEASAAPYKFHHYGVNLVGFEHGHSIKQQVRLAALMANENRESWSTTLYREWHLGDQHRKGSAKPCMFEEQGVGVEYLPSLTAVNEWHTLKGLNWQKRAGMAFVWDKEAGPIARLQVNINSYDGKLMKSTGK